MENALAGIWTDTARLACKAVVAVGLLSAPQVASACVAPPYSLSWGADELIEKSESIVLATVVLEDMEILGDFAHRPLFIFQWRLRPPIENLKGEAPKFVSSFALSLLYLHSSQDFHDHTDEEFWTTNVGRTPYYSDGACGPEHTFIEGETYLLFLGGKDERRVQWALETSNSFDAENARLRARNLVNAQHAMKSAEIIRTPDDKWLQYVRDSLDEN